ncbi:ankyrin repeat and SOCS box protein 9 [Boleophthalmus pectinirostris]|uniref:ankyrin repeat and SOCS box protein 9 n=1 Tax=Boleophthalmus pectinirostris TaxID=150288 RepID=UPI002430194B|nr:ankyrin repeat and SOCS box protein 9 [Boleophthalmus pectinirostris]
MSVCDKETCPDASGPTGNAVVFSNPLMSDYESDWSQMHDAAFNGYVLSLRRLISQGFSVNLNTLDRVSPLLTACTQGHTACAKLLLENGANINSRTVDGHTALAMACARGHGACVSVLLQHGASPTGTSLSSSPIHRAAAKDNVECIEQLVQFGADVDQHIEQSGSPLQTACRHQQLNTVRKLLQLGANVNSMVSGESPLHTAVRLSCPEIVSTLLEHGADHNLRDPQGKRPLDIAPPNSQVAQLLKQVGEECSLLKLCRVIIRRTVGKNRLSEIHDLQIPNELKHYLLHQSESRRIKSH